MKGFLMLLGTGVFTVVLIYGAWYIGTHFRIDNGKVDQSNAKADGDIVGRDKVNKG